LDLAILKKAFFANKWSRYFLAIVGGAISAITVFMAVAFALFVLTRILLGWTGKPGMEFWVIFGTAFLCGIVGGFIAILAIAKEGRFRAFFQWWTKLRFFRWFIRPAIACAFWIFFLSGFIYIFDELRLAREYGPKLELAVAVIWMNLPILWTMYRVFKRTDKEWDWWLITLLIVYSNCVLLVFFSGTTIELNREVWTPNVHFLRGQWYGFAFISVVLAIGFLIRLVKRRMSLPMFFYYGIGLVLPLGLIFLLYANEV
jgi:hypothetical protein